MFNFIVSSILSYSFYLNPYSGIHRAIHDISYGRIVEMSDCETEKAVIIQGDQKVSVHLTITIQKYTKYSILNSFSHLPQ
jgi:hypothetical protein